MNIHTSSRQVRQNTRAYIPCCLSGNRRFCSSSWQVLSVKLSLFVSFTGLLSTHAVALQAHLSAPHLFIGHSCASCLKVAYEVNDYGESTYFRKRFPEPSSKRRNGVVTLPHTLRILQSQMAKVRRKEPTFEREGKGHHAIQGMILTYSRRLL